MKVNSGPSQTTNLAPQHHMEHPQAQQQPSTALTVHRNMLPQVGSSSPPRKGLFARFKKSPTNAAGLPANGKRNPLDIDARNLRDNTMTALDLAIEEGRTVDALEMLKLPASDPVIRQHTLGMALNKAAQKSNLELIAALRGASGLTGNSAIEIDPMLNTPLHVAAQHGNLECINALLKNTDLSHPRVNKLGDTALHDAAAFKDSAVVKALLATNAFDPDEKNYDDLTPLQCAIYWQNPEAGKALMEIPDLDLNAIDIDGRSPINAAARAAANEIAAALLQKEGIDVNKPDKQGLTPLHTAVLTRSFEIFKLLLQQKRIDPNRQNLEGNTALMFAVTAGDTACIAELAKHENVLFNKPNNLGYYPLHIAIKAPNIATLEAILQRKDLDLEVKYRGRTPLEMAQEENDPTKLRMLQRYQKARNASNPNTKDADGKTALMAAIETQSSNTVTKMMQHPSFAPNLKDKDGRTALFYAAKFNNLGALKALLALTDIAANEATALGATPLYIAAQNAHADVVSALLKHPTIDVNAALVNSRATPLLTGAKNGSTSVVRALLAHPKIDCNVVTKDGASPLYVAAANGHRAVVDLLLARPEIRFDLTFEGKTIFTAAKTPEIRAAIYDARAIAAINRGEAIPFDGKRLDVASIATDEAAAKTVAHWLASGVHRRDLVRLRHDIDAYTKTATMPSAVFNTRYERFFASGFEVENPDLRKNLALLWRNLPEA